MSKNSTDVKEKRVLRGDELGEGTRIKRSREDLTFDIISYTLLILMSLIVLYPLYFIVISSFSDPYQVLSGDVILLPKGLNVDSYARVFKEKSIWTGYRNSLVYTVLGTALNVFLTATIAYPLSRKYFSGRKVITTILLITMFFSGGLIPTYILVNNLKLRNTLWVMIFLGAVSAYNVIIARTNFEANISSELEEAASIDGCAPIRFFFTMVLPLSKAILAVLVLYYAVGHWNDYMRGLVYLTDQERYPLQLVIRSILLTSKMIDFDNPDVEAINHQMRVAEGMKYGVIIISSVPVLVIYPFIQKYFVQGVMIGSVKG
jgi:putative aldouronate transport system permease protein